MLVPPFANSPFWPPNWNTDPQCWEVFYRKAISYANIICEDQHLAEDAVQEAALYILRTYQNIDYAPQEWCLSIVRGKCIDIFRKRNRKSLRIDFHPPSHYNSQGNSTPSPLDLAVDQSPTPDRAAEKLDESELKSELIKCMLESLKPKVRHVFKSYYINQEPQRKIADSLQTTENAVKVMLNRARDQLRTQFSKEFASLQFINA